MGCGASKKKEKGSLFDQIMNSVPADCAYVKPLVLIGQSGSGKTTLIKHLQQHFGEKMIKAVSVTTRAPHKHEINGVDYIFVDKAEFKKEHDAGMFFEHAKVNGHSYGLHLNFIKNAIANEKICVIDVNLEGAQKIHATGLECHFILVEAPSKEKLIDRLRQEGCYDDATVTEKAACFDKN